MCEDFAVKLLSLISLAASFAAGQSVQSKKDIPAIAKAADGAVVSIVMSDKDGKPIAQGSGFLVGKDGVIITNYHVIAEGTSALVKLPDGAFFVVDGVLAFDKARDVAVIKAHGGNFRTLTLGNSDRVQVGQEVVAIGNPLSLESTVSNGIVSGIRTDQKLGGKFLQVTTPISPGSSGGPLFNMEGQVVGITTMYVKGGENLNFAIPINDAKPLLAATSANLQNLPNEPELAETRTQNRDDGAPPAGESMSSLKTAVEMMQRMVEPEHREVLLGAQEVKAAQLPLPNGPLITIISNQPVRTVLPTGTSEEHGYPEFTYTVASDSAGGRNYPRFVSFALRDIDPSSIRSMQGGYDPSALVEFWNKHPKCEADPQCSHEYLAFLHSAPRQTVVLFHTTDLKLLIERGGFESQGSCTEDHCRPKPILDESVGKLGIFFGDKDRAERFVTALIDAVKSAGGKLDLFPPTP